VRFNDTGYEVVSNGGALRRGELKDYLHPSISGVGFLGAGDYSTSHKNLAKITWASMILRCYSGRVVAYVDCEVCEEWHNFQNFAKGYYKNYPKDPKIVFELDKDIKIKGNKVYSPDTCCFVPQVINSLFISRANHRGPHALGVHWKKRDKKFHAQCQGGSGGPRTYMGPYDTEDEAFGVYKEFKEKVIKTQPDKFKHLLPEGIYDILQNYIVEKGD